MTVQLLRRRFTAKEYGRMVEAGILQEDDRVELLEGEIVEMAPIGSRHAACVDRLNRLFSDGLRGRTIVRVQSPIWLGDYSEPQPDLALLRPRSDFYSTSHPGAGDTLLVVEVADTSADYDRQVKLALYAQAGILEAWLVDLASGSVELHRAPGPAGYREVQRAGVGHTIAPLAFPELALQVSGIVA
jgi:Uma2 family endonuclease